MQFDWHETIARRPVFSVDYWPGTPALDREGRKDLLKGSEAEIERWQRETVKKLEPLIDQYRSQGLRSDRSACPLYLAKACRG